MINPVLIVVLFIKGIKIIFFCSNAYSQSRQFDYFRLTFCFLYSVQVQDVANENVRQAPTVPPVSVPHSKAVSKKPAAAKKASAAKGKAKFSKIIFR